MTAAERVRRAFAAPEGWRLLRRTSLARCIRRALYRTMLRITDLTLARGAKRLLEGANLTVHAGHKVGLVGAERLRQVESLRADPAARLHQDAGSDRRCRRRGRSRTSRRKRLPWRRAAIEFVLDGDRELRAIERALAAAEHADVDDPERTAKRSPHLHHRFDDDRRLRGARRARRRCSPAWASPARATATRSRVSPAAGGCGSISRRR